LQQSTQAQYNCNTSFYTASCRKLVLQRCIAGVSTSATQIQYKKKILALELYCTCADRFNFLVLKKLTEILLVQSQRNGPDQAEKSTGRD